MKLDSENECEKCDPKCSECVHEKSFCLKCREDLATDESDDRILALKLNSCVFVAKSSECDQAMFYDVGSGDCRFCDITCEECSGRGEYSCLKCAQRRPYIQDGRCVDKCSDGYYLSAELSRCLRCGPDCQECDEAKCRVCQDGFVLNGDQQCERKLFYGS